MSIQPLFTTLRAVTLDLWQTLVLDRPDLGKVRSTLRVDGTLRVLAQAGIAVSREQIEQAYHRSVEAHWKIQGEGRDVSFEEQVEEFLHLVDPDLPGQVDGTVRHQVSKRYAGPFLAFPPGLAPGARQVLETLKRRGFRVGLISNTGMTPGRMFRDYLAALGVAHYFDVLVFSDEAGVSKPAPEIFRQTLERLGVEPSHAAHVGDSLGSDVAGAQGVGMRAVWLRGAGVPQSQVLPDATITHLWELPELLEREGSPRP